VGAPLVQRGAVRIGLFRETFPGETRVALAPDGAARLRKLGHDVIVERGAGERALFADEEYAAAGATIGAPEEAELLLLVQPPGEAEIARLRSGHALVALLDPVRAPAPLQQLAGRGVVLFALDLMPRTTRAQSMDVLSSMSTIAGYKAALLAANHLGKLFPMLMTAAGTVPPARVLVIGAGVAGLQAIATARRLGAQVEGYDVRPEAKEQVLSLGATFLEAGIDAAAAAASGYARELGEEARRRQADALRERIGRFDAVIATALVPGRPAPRIVTIDMVRSMRPGSVIVDLAAPAGGNCEGTRPGETALEGGVSILGPMNLPALLPGPASRMFSRNVTAFLEHILRDGKLVTDSDDEIVRGTLVAQGGRMVER